MTMSGADHGVPVQLLAFDLMDTVVVDPFFAVVPAVTGMSLEELFAVTHPSSWLEFERGLIDEQTFVGRFYREEVERELPDPRLIVRTVLDNYRFVPGMERLLARLAGGKVLRYVLSNYTVWIDRVRQELKLDRFFDGYVISCESGARKPEAEAYHALCHRAGLQPAHCLLIDDRRANVEGAQAMGMAAVRSALLGSGIAGRAVNAPSWDARFGPGAYGPGGPCSLWASVDSASRCCPRTALRRRYHGAP
jgi:HAD superfamily hydrolase (TIGR01549 family)